MKSFHLAFSIISVVDAVNYPLGITNCGISSWIPKVPERAISMNQGTTEMLLALGLADRTVGTAYLDDEIWGELADDFAKIPNLSDSYPSAKQIQDLKPDFLYAAYSSAFATSHVNYTDELLDECTLTFKNSGKNRTTCRQELHEEGMQTYLQTPYCELVEHRPTKVTVENLYEEIWDIATIFDVLDKGRILIDSIDEHFSKALDVSNSVDNQEQPLRVLWLDSISKDGKPFVGSCCGAVQVILEHAGAENVFSELGVAEKKSWDTVSWEDVAATNPDLIVVVDASWDSIEEKIFGLCSNPLARELRAVQNRAFLTVPFSGSTLGVRIGSLAYNLAEGMAALSYGTPLPSLEFSEVSMSSGSQAVTRSGVKVYTSLPEWNGTDLHSFCPGSSPDLVYAEAREESQAKDGLEGWAVSVISVLGVTALCMFAFMAVVVSRERNGKPMFAPETVTEKNMD